jgi:RNA polymerase sigma factor (sigma-70 family)
MAMVNGDRSPVAHYLHQLIRQPRTDGPTDAQLVERFAAQRDGTAFQVLLSRYGPMVLGICRRVLRHQQDAEDAFQATFLVLWRKSGSIGRRDAVGSWLQRVAFRVALRARGLAVKRTTCQLVELPAPESTSDLLWRDLRPVLDEEVDRLPAKYRAPFVLCYQSGLTNEEAAEELGCPKGTVQSRLAWARQRLQARLTRRGLAPSTILLLAALANGSQAALVPPALVRATFKAVQHVAGGGAVASAVSANVTCLTKGALQAMLWTNVKLAITGALVLAVLGWSGTLAWQALGAGPVDEVNAAVPQAKKEPRKADIQPLTEEKRFTFEVHDQPWNKVLEWYAEASGLPLVSAVVPKGTVTFIPPKDKRDFTLSEITDFLNEMLLSQKYILLRRPASFTLLAADEKVESAQVPRVAIDDIAKRGKTELVSVVLPLTNITAKEIAPDVKKLLSAFGDVVVLEKANQLVVLDTARNLQHIRQLIIDTEKRQSALKDQLKPK